MWSLCGRAFQAEVSKDEGPEAGACIERARKLAGGKVHVGTLNVISDGSQGTDHLGGTGLWQGL